MPQIHRLEDYRFVINDSSPKFTIKPNAHFDIAR